MTPPSVAVKSTAKAILKGNFYRCVCACLIPIFISLSISFTTAIAGMAIGGTLSYIFMIAMDIFLLVPCFLGLLRFFKRLMWEQKDDILVVFHYFGSFTLYKKAVLSGLAYALRLLLIGVAVYLPSIIISILTRPELYDLLGITMPPFIISLGGALTAFNVISFAVFIIVAVRFYLTPFLLVADEDMDVGEALHMSRVISKKSAIDFVGLFCSLSFWVIISFFVIPLPFTLPYIITAYMVHCRFSVAHYNKLADSANRNDVPFYSSEN
ncbi:MAG: DUF975 family protein [Clostridia bacterium]|nr:DUF975 family protein [Clostridia bacterium]